MKKTFLLIALFTAILSVSKAQPRQQRTPEEMAQRNVEMLEKRLNLTADQKAKVYSTILSQYKTMDSLRTAGRNSDADRQEMFSKMRAMQEENDKKISALLTDDQKKTYEEWVKERQSRMRGGMGRQGGQNPQ